MYTVYIPKYQGDKTNYNIIKVLNRYMAATDYNSTILCAPGYMNTSQKTTEEFYDEIERIFRKTKQGEKERNVAIGIFNGMNGTNFISGSCESLRELHEEEIAQHNSKLVPLCCKKTKEHQKIMFFMENIRPFEGSITCKTYECFLETVIVRAVMIGSSNQSLTTYYGGSAKKIADKGETDVFMFINADKKARDSILENANEEHQNIVVSESIYVPGGVDEAYLKSILKEFLKNSLALNNSNFALE